MVTSQIDTCIKLMINSVNSEIFYRQPSFFRHQSWGISQKVNANKTLDPAKLEIFCAKSSSVL